MMFGDSYHKTRSNVSDFWSTSYRRKKEMQETRQVVMLSACKWAVITSARFPTIAINSIIGSFVIGKKHLR
eukprot:344936-Amphidinium_carterae.1